MFSKVTGYCGFIGISLVSLCLSGCGDTAPQPTEGQSPTPPEQGVFYPTPPDPPRLQFLTSFSTSTDLGPSLDKKQTGFERFVLGDEEEVKDGIAKPYGLALSEDKVYVCDVQKRLVEILDLKQRTFGYLSRERRMSNPVNICVVNGIKYVADPTAGQVFVFGRDNELKTILGGDLGLQPIDVEVRGRRCYVTDMNSNQVVVLDITTGQVVLRIGKAGDQLGQFVLIGDLALDEQENIYVTDKLLGRVTIFNRNGIFQRAFGKADKSIHSFVRPKGIDVDRAGRIWVVDAAPEVAKIYSGKGKLMLFFGFPGNKPGSMNMPASILIDYDHIDLFSKYYVAGAQIEFLVWVSNQYGQKINVYGFGRFPRQEQAIEEARQATVAEVKRAVEADEQKAKTKAPPTQRPQETPSSAASLGAPATVPAASTNTPTQDSMQEIADTYYRSVYLYRRGRYQDARPGFVKVLDSQQIPPRMAQTIRNYLADIDRRLGR